MECEKKRKSVNWEAGKITCRTILSRRSSERTAPPEDPLTSSTIGVEAAAGGCNFSTSPWDSSSTISISAIEGLAEEASRK
ncbi:hypothetical protein HPP92_009429 [Vanilla planifolia]|uniref:Uncharacterized protein n=1 Tax=Vanilla planifolia TaxID=51239 RepID=A0A835RE93_VANPL|nr:hypothetical protein HPP92_009429 [Vanilla planifolia]